MDRVTIIRRTPKGEWGVVEEDMVFDHAEDAMLYYVDHYLQNDQPGEELLFFINGQPWKVMKVEKQDNVIKTTTTFH